MPDKSAMSLADDMISRLPAGREQSVPDVCAAWNIHRDVVEGWIDSGEVDAIDMGGGSKRDWVICKYSLKDFLYRRAEGVRAPAEKRIGRNQLDLISDS